VIICLYDAPGYPLQNRIEPIWENLPDGFFRVTSRGKIDCSTDQNLKGRFFYADNKDSIRPIVGDTFLAAFSYKRVRYLYIASLTYTFPNDTSRKKKWDAFLSMPSTRLIKKW